MRLAARRSRNCIGSSARSAIRTGGAITVGTRYNPRIFFGNVQRAQHFEYHRQLAKIGKPLDRAEWAISPPTVDAYYDPQMNDINFPAGVLQPPLFDPKMDGAPNFGNTGATIGHELTHGFDDSGRQFDADGNRKDWWTAKDSEEFEQRAKCVSDQYSQYAAVDDIKINGKLTLGEDIADLGGTFLAYVAWKKATASGDLRPIDGFTPDQRFFIGMAQWACGDTRPELKRELAIVDQHSPLDTGSMARCGTYPSFRRHLPAKPASRWSAKGVPGLVSGASILLAARGAFSYDV